MPPITCIALLTTWVFSVASLRATTVGSTTVSVMSRRKLTYLDTNSRPPPPMFTPYTVRGVTLKNRVVVSPMAQYSCEDGVPGDYHLVHLGARAMGGAAMVVVNPIPGQESRNSDFLLENGAAIKINMRLDQQKMEWLLQALAATDCPMSCPHGLDCYHDFDEALKVAQLENKPLFVDFNKAYNLPCAFTEYATCTFPPPENNMMIAIEAGEYYKGHH